MQPSSLVLEQIIKDCLEEDLGHGHDITSQTVVAPGTNMTAHFIARQDGILAGMDPALSTFMLTTPNAEVIDIALDGQRIKSGERILSIQGDATSILSTERTALNFLTHLSGIASLTHKYVQAVEGTKAKICDTRKTLPRLRALQKYAVALGGGVNHRFGLDDAILIKDNHIALSGSIETALSVVQKQKRHLVCVEIEVDTLDQLNDVLEFYSNNGGVDVVMLDNFSIKDLKKAVQIVDGRLITEASGGVTLETVSKIAQTGVDYISVGALTHSAPALDIGMDTEPL